MRLVAGNHVLRFHGAGWGTATDHRLRLRFNIQPKVGVMTLAGALEALLEAID